MELLLPLLLLFEATHCSHFRGGIFTWKHLSGNEVRVTHRMSWRNTYYSPVCDDNYKSNRTQRSFGTISCLSGCSGSWSNPSITSVCTDYSTLEDWATFEGMLNITLSSSVIVIGHTSCCWIDTLLLNPSSQYTIATRIDLSYRQDIGGINTSPVTAMQPIVRLQRGCSHSIKIPVADDNRDVIRCRWARNSSECGGICNSFPGAILNETECRLDYSPESDNVGYYGVAIQIEDFANASSFTPLSSIPLQFLVLVFNSSSACASAPTFISPTPPNGGCYEAVQGVLISIEIRINSSQQIHEVTTQSPVGLTKSKIKTISPTEYSVSLTWTPSSSQQGSFIVCFTGVDNMGLTTESRCVTLNAIRSSSTLTVVSDSQHPSGIVFGDNRQWSLQYSNYFVRPSTSTYIRVYESNGLLVETIDVTSSSVVYPQSTSGRQLTFHTSYNFHKGRTYYILFDEGVVNEEFGCSVESPAIDNITFWTFSLYNDECATNPCQNSGTCVNGVNYFNCSCDIDHYGSVCEFRYIRCRDSPCENNATCSDIINGYECLCPGGYTDVNCTTDIDECASGPCQNGGTCVDGVNSFSCTCDSDHYGNLCENRYIRCRDAPCENNATCSDITSGYKCHCPDGYSDVNCSTDINECVSNPCHNGGTCVDNVNYFLCACAIDFYGSVCEFRYTRCHDFPCKNNATCSDVITGYTCSCPNGYTDINCTTDINECASGPCQNNGTCVDGVDSFTCACDSDHYGTFCEHRYTRCRDAPCENNATCYDVTNGYKCICLSGYTDVNCSTDINECASNPCQNGGTCFDGVNFFSCACDDDYYGNLCANRYIKCRDSPCKNKATCSDTREGYECHCPKGYIDVNCSTDIDECASGPCENNATCSDGIDSFTCQCLPEYYGELCREKVLNILSFESSGLMVREGKPVEFKLLLQSNTTHEFQWFHNGLLITNSSTRYKVTNLKAENGTSIVTLLIAKTLQRDQGEWKVTVSNSLISEERHLTIAVIPRLVLQMEPQYDFSIQLGDTLNLLCIVTNPNALVGVHNGSIMIKKDGFLLPIDGTYISTTWHRLAATENDTGRYTCLHSEYPDPVFTSVYVTVMKPEQKRCEGEYSDSILWNTTLADTLKREPCPANQRGIATRYCNSEGIWDPTNLLNCTNEAFMNASVELDGIIEDGIKNPEKVQETVANTLQVMKNLTSSTNEISPGDLSSSMDILEKIVNVTNSTGSTIEEEVFFSVVDSMLSSNNSEAWSTVSEKTEKDASSLLRNMDRLSEVVIQNDNITATEFNGSNFKLTINRTKLDETGIRFPRVTSNNVSAGTDEFSTFLELPKQVTAAKNEINYVAVIYRSIAEILPSDSDRADNEEGTSKKKAYVNSQVLSLTTQTDIGVLNPPLNLTFRHINSHDSTDMQATCVSWSFTNNNWTESGCKLSQNDNKRTVCQCNHLTNFAILMRPYIPKDEDTPSLKTMSLIGVIFSIAFTVLTFTIYILTWRFIKSDQNIMMLNLCASLVVAYVVFISAVEKTKNEGLCIAITAILHYLFLVTFFNMLGIGLYYFMSITVTYYAMYVANNFKSKSRVRWFLMGVWGIPLLITMTSMGVFWGKGYHLQFYCWLSMESGSLYMFIVPVCVIAVMNLIIIVSLVRVLCATSVMSKSSLQKKAASGLRSLGTLLPVLGVTWLFGILAVNENTDVFQYLFVIANSLQGFFIFVSHVLLNQKIMLGLRNKYPALNSLVSRTESNKKESSSISRTQSSSRPNVPLLKVKKNIFERYLTRKRTQRNKVEKSHLFMTEKTVSTDIGYTSDSHEKSSVMSENHSENKKLELIMEEDNQKRKFRFTFNFNPWKKKYTVTEM